MKIRGARERSGDIVVDDIYKIVDLIQAVMAVDFEEKHVVTNFVTQNFTFTNNLELEPNQPRVWSYVHGLLCAVAPFLLSVPTRSTNHLTGTAVLCYFVCLYLVSSRAPWRGQWRVRIQCAGGGGVTFPLLS